MLGALVDAADSLSQQVDQTVFRYRLLEEEEGAGLSGLDGAGKRSLSADHDHLGLGVDLLEPTEQLDAVHVRQRQVVKTTSGRHCLKTSSPSAPVRAPRTS